MLNHYAAHGTLMSKFNPACIQLNVYPQVYITKF